MSHLQLILLGALAAYGVHCLLNPPVIVVYRPEIDVHLEPSEDPEEQQ